MAKDNGGRYTSKKLTQKVKDKIIYNLRKELETALMYDESALELTSAKFFADDLTCEIIFRNKVGAEFTYFNVWYDEKTGEILQSQIKIGL